MGLAELRRMHDEVTYKQLVTDVALEGAKSAADKTAKAVARRLEEHKTHINGSVTGQAITNNESAIQNGSNLGNKPSSALDEPQWVQDIVKSLDDIPLGCEPKYSDEDIFGIHRDAEWWETRFEPRPLAQPSPTDNEPANSGLAKIKKSIEQIKQDKSSERKEMLLKMKYAIAKSRQKEIAEADIMNTAWMQDMNNTNKTLRIVDEDGDVIMEGGGDLAGKAEEWIRQGAHVGVEFMDVDTDAPTHGPEYLAQPVKDSQPQTNNTTLSWDAHIKYVNDVSHHNVVGLRSWYDWFGITKFLDQRQTNNDAAVGAAQFKSYDDIDDEHVDVKPVVKTWEYMKQRMAKVFGKRKYSVLHRSANRYNRRVAMIKTLVSELKANAVGVFTKSEADKRALHLCAKQVVEKAWKEGVELGVDCEVRKIRRNERAYYLRAVCTAYHLGDDDSAFWSALESVPDPHQA